MKNTKIRCLLSSLGLFTLLFLTTIANAAPVRFNQVKQILRAKPGKAKTGNFTQLRLSDDPAVAKTDETKTTPQDDRVIITKTTEIIEDDTCDCGTIIGDPPDFPKWALLGLGAIPVGLILANRGNNSLPPSSNPPLLPEPPSPPKPDPVPEPMTILLFGTGLAGIGVVARKRFHRKRSKDKLSDIDCFE